jgi:hypothetical protein
MRIICDKSLDFKKQAETWRSNLRGVYRIQGGITCGNQMWAFSASSIHNIFVRYSALAFNAWPRRA